MPVFVLHHYHLPNECAAAFAAWAGFQSPLRRRTVASTCVTGGHELWWRVRASDRAAALAQLPCFVADRTTAIEVREIRIP
jgi:gamma-glutamyl:cysteine ligase YbdK (ATP-grasp superfamily)